MRIGVNLVPSSPGESLALARLAEESGIDLVGIADSPQLFGATYPTVQHVLAGTRRIRVGPMVSNPLTRHVSVQGADLAALAELYPERVVAGFGSGDSAVRSVGLAPASAQVLAEYVQAIGRRVAGDVPLYVAVGGLGAARSVPAAAAGIVLGGGLDAPWLERLASEAERSAGHSLERWLFLVGWLLDSPGRLDQAKLALRASIAGVSQHALASEEARETVPGHLREGIKELRAGYRADAYGQPRGRNAALLSLLPAEERYLMDRFALVGTAAQVAPRLVEVAAGRVDGVLIGSSVPDRAQHIRAIGAGLRPLLEAAGGARPTVNLNGEVNG